MEGTSFGQLGVGGVLIGDGSHLDVEVPLENPITICVFTTGIPCKHCLSEHHSIEMCPDLPVLHFALPPGAHDLTEQQCW